MRRPAALLLAPLLLVGLPGLLTACGGGSDSASQSGSPLPTVSGTYGQKPTVNVPSDLTAGSKLKVKVLKQGNGPKVAKGDLLVADYLGQIYATGKVFDNSYDRHQPAAFQIGAGKVIPGWDKGLVGVPTGSRVEMVIPPADGYGTQGNAQAGIKGTDSLVFVVDLIAAYGKGAALPDNAPVSNLPTDLPKVTGATSTQPTISIPKGTTPPTKAKVTILDKGTGPAVAENKLTVVQYDALRWDGKQLSSSWADGGPQAVPVGLAGQPSPFDLLVGIPAGSRVLLSLPADANNKPAVNSVAVVVDVLGQHGPAKESAS